MAGKTLGHYQLLEKIGAGGQGTVYKAIDDRLGRTVVVKVLPGELTAKPSNLKRFEREARLASSLDHPNICTIFDLDEAAGVHFITMQHIQGRNVRELLRGKPLNLKSAIAIAIQVTDALSAAHERGIIHRDVKATNVMVTKAGQVKLLDFGLAKLIDDEAAEARNIHATQLTELGVPYGTATYAAPEQARGEKVDHRADIFSTGVLLYEMLTGVWPFRGKSSVEVRHSVIHETPKPIAQVRQSPVPPQLQRIVERAMAKDPGQRYQTAPELRAELADLLKEMQASVVDAGATVPMQYSPPQHMQGRSRVARAVNWLKNVTRSDESFSDSNAVTETSETVLMPQGPAAPAKKERKTIAILPFKNLVNNAEFNFYEFALADAVITELARLRSLVVRPSSLIARYQGTAIDPREAGRDMNVHTVLSAGFLHAGDRIRVNAQLIDVNSGDLLWSERIDAAAEDLIAVQDTIAEKIVKGLSVELRPDEQVGIARHGTTNAAAFEEYLRGRDAFARFIFHTNSPDDCNSALAHFGMAVSLDPNFALAHDGVGACHVNRVFKGLGDASDFRAAERAFAAALQLDPDVVEARMLMTFILLWKGEKATAREEVERARRRYPNEPVVYFVQATLHRLDGRFDDALKSLAKMAKLDPAASSVVALNRGLISIYRGEFDQAINELSRAEEQDPDNPLLKAYRAMALYYRALKASAEQVSISVHESSDTAAQDLLVQAELVLSDITLRFPALHGIRPLLAMCLSRQGRNLAAKSQLTDAAKRNAMVDPDISYVLASAYAVLGKREEAFEWLNRSVEIGNGNRTLFLYDPNLESIRDDQRFQLLKQRL